MTALRSLDLRHGGPQLQHCSALSALGQLTALHADAVGSTGGACLPACLSTLTQLQRLELGNDGNHRSGRTSIPAVSSIGPLTALQRLTHLKLDTSPDAALRRLPADITALSALQHLNVSYCPLGSEGGWEHLALLPHLTR